MDVKSSDISSNLRLLMLVLKEFINILVDETIQLLAYKAFKKELFNWKYKLKLENFELLYLAVKHQLFQIDGKLYEQVVRVAMGSPLGPLMANVFMCSIEDKLVERNFLTSPVA